MSFTHHFSVLPGDARQDHLVDILLSKGRQVAFDMPLEKLCAASPVILGPIPFHYSYDALSLMPGQIVFGGCLSGEFLLSCKQNNVNAVDYMTDKELTVFNAIATAEGTIASMIQHSYYNLHGSPVLILGFGVCAKALADRLSSMHADICICARNQAARAEAVSLGFDAIPFEDLWGRLPGFLFIVNTVPSPVLTKELLHFVHPECLLTDIASAPGGIDKDGADKLQFHFQTLPGIPGKISPKSSAAYMASFLLKTLCTAFANPSKETGVQDGSTQAP